jgi:hypothetical protein
MKKFRKQMTRIMTNESEQGSQTKLSRGQYLDEKSLHGRAAVKSMKGAHFGINITCDTEFGHIHFLLCNDQFLLKICNFVC